MKLTQHVIEREAAKTLKECPYIELDVQRRRIEEHSKRLLAVMKQAESDNMKYYGALQRIRHSLRYGSHEVPPEKDNEDAIQEVQDLLNQMAATIFPGHTEEDDEVDEVDWEAELEREEAELEEAMAAFEIRAPEEEDEPLPQVEVEEKEVEEQEIIFEEEEEPAAAATQHLSIEEEEKPAAEATQQPPPNPPTPSTNNLPEEITVQQQTAENEESAEDHWEFLGSKERAEHEDVTQQQNLQEELDEFKQRVEHCDELDAAGRETLKREYEQFEKKMRNKDGNIADDVTVTTSNQQSKGIDSSNRKPSTTQPPRNQSQRVNPPDETKQKAWGQRTTQEIRKAWKLNLLLHRIEEGKQTQDIPPPPPLQGEPNQTAPPPRHYQPTKRQPNKAINAWKNST